MNGGPDPVLIRINEGTSTAPDDPTHRPDLSEEPAAVDKNDEDRILHVLDTVAEMAIATLREDGWPQTTTVAFANDGLAIYFGTAADSQKDRSPEPKKASVVECGREF